MNYALAYHRQIEDLRQYLLPLMTEEFGDLCADCGEQKDSYQIDHMRYGDDITMYDLQLLCVDCHKLKSMASGDAYLTRTSHCATCTCYKQSIL